MDGVNVAWGAEWTVIRYQNAGCCAGGRRGGRAGGFGFATTSSASATAIETLGELDGVCCSCAISWRRGGVDGSNEARTLLSFDTMDSSAALAGGEELSIPGGCRGGSDASCSAFVECERGGSGGGTGRAGRAGAAGADVGGCSELAL